MAWISAALSGIAGLLNSLFKWTGLIAVWAWTKERARRKAAEKAERIKDKQIEIASKPPLRRSDLLERMRKRKRGN